MADIVTSEQRSRNMAAIRGRHTKPEILVRRFLHASGLRFRIHPALPGRPDLVLPAHRTAVFVHGCFWHRHDCPNGRVWPATRPEFWRAKLSGNAERDVRTVQKLEELGWRVLTVWECDLGEKTLEKLVRDISRPRRKSPPGKSDRL